MDRLRPPLRRRPRSPGPARRRMASAWGHRRRTRGGDRDCARRHRGRGV